MSGAIHKKYSCQSFQPVPAVQRDRAEELVVGDLLRGFHESRQGRPPRRAERGQPSPDQTRQLECRAQQQGFFLFFMTHFTPNVFRLFI